MVETVPANGQQTERLAQEAAVAMRKGDLAAAHAIAEKCIAAGAEHPLLLKVEALWLHNSGHYQDALRTFHHARTLTPGDPMILNGIAGCLSGMGEYEAALSISDEALAIAPDVSSTHYLRGWILEALQDFPAARQAYARAAAINPKHIQALAGLASVAIRLGDLDAARRNAETALALEPGQPTAILALALAELGQGEAPRAEARARDLLKSALPSPIRARAFGVLGDALDAQNRTAEAWAAYGQKAAEFFTKDAASAMIDPLVDLASRLNTMPAEQWQRSTLPSVEDGPRLHVFLLGFPRSGTEELETALATHPGVVSFQGGSSLKELAQEFIDPPEGLEQLVALDGEALENARLAYWQRIRDRGLAVKGKLFLDKSPFNTINLPLIAKLFPDAKVIFALRDPRDVVLDCYRSQSGSESTPSPFQSLEDWARLYASVTSIALIGRTKLGLALHELRFGETAAAALCDVLSLEASDALRRLDEKHRHGGDWRRYREQLEPILPLLAPFAAAFDYPSD